MNTRTVAKRFKTDEEKLKIIMEIKANLENVKKNEADKGMKIKKEKKTKKMKMNKQSVYELDDEESDDPDYNNNHDEVIEKGITSDKRKKWFGIVTRRLQNTLHSINSLNKRQRGLVTSMGFGKLLSFNVKGIPSKLGHYVVDNLDTSLPLGAIDISALIEANECTKFFSKWRRRYGRRRISPRELVSNISNEKYEDDIVFKLDFLVLFLTTVDCWRNGLCKHGNLEVGPGSRSKSL
ncbi:hypothetical protein R6Q59_002952 [Mikania micrantha]